MGNNTSQGITHRDHIRHVYSTAGKKANQVRNHL